MPLFGPPAGAGVPSTGGTYTGEVVAPDFKASGLPGAVAASRYVGATTGGAPASGTFAVGDFIVDQLGVVFVCVTAGTPGTWKTPVRINDTLFNTAMGTASLPAATGSGNTALGYQALNLNGSGADNTAVGVNALVNNTTASSNTAMGRSALSANTTGGNNTAVGLSALTANTTGNNNTAIGVGSAQGQTTASSNVIIGFQTGFNPNGVVANATTTGLQQTLVGVQAGQASATQRTNVVALGFNALVDGDNAVAIGPGVLAGAAGAVAIGRDNANASASTVVANEIKLGTALHTTNVPGVHLTAGRRRTAAAKTASYTMVATDDVILADATAAAVTITSAAAVAGRTCTVKKIDGSINAVTFTPASGTVDGAASNSIATQNTTRHYICDGTNWFVI